jgi:hypothetical protein
MSFPELCEACGLQLVNFLKVMAEETRIDPGSETAETAPSLPSPCGVSGPIALSAKQVALSGRERLQNRQYPC